MASRGYFFRGLRVRLVGYLKLTAVLLRKLGKISYESKERNEF